MTAHGAGCTVQYSLACQALGSLDIADCTMSLKTFHADHRLQPIVKVTPEDQEALTMVRAISSLLPQSSRDTMSPNSPASGQLAAELYPLLVEVLPGLSRTGAHDFVHLESCALMF